MLSVPLSLRPNLNCPQYLQMRSGATVIYIVGKTNLYLSLYNFLISAFAIDRKADLESIDKKMAEQIVELVNEIQDLIKEDEILLFYGTKYDARQDASEIKKDMEKNRNTLVEALAKKGIAQCAQGNIDEATETLFKLLKFTDITDSKVTIEYLKVDRFTR